MTSRLAKTTDAGFSLVEMLVAVGLFALIGLGGVTLVQTILSAQRGTEDRLARLGQLQRALYLVSFDLQEASPKSLVLTDDTLIFSRRDIAGQQISISYAMIDGVLVRTIDATRRQPLLTGVTGIGWHFHFARLGWVDALAEDKRQFPDGIELDLATKPEGALRRVVDLTTVP